MGIKTTMGCGPTKEGGAGAESETREPGHCVIEFVRACNVAKMDAFDTESDPYIKAHIESTKRPGHKLSKTIKTQGRRRLSSLYGTQLGTFRSCQSPTLMCWSWNFTIMTRC